MLSKHTQMLKSGPAKFSPRNNRRMNRPQASEQSIYSFLRDAYYNFRFKSRSGVTTPKQLAMTFEPQYSKTAHVLKETAEDFGF